MKEIFPEAVKKKKLQTVETRCERCWKDKKLLVLPHIHPSLGGRNTEENALVLCNECKNEFPPVTGFFSFVYLKEIFIPYESEKALLKGFKAYNEIDLEVKISRHFLKLFRDRESLGEYLAIYNSCTSRNIGRGDITEIFEK